jgi:hypothetical protein
VDEYGDPVIVKLSGVRLQLRESLVLSLIESRVALHGRELHDQR